MLIVSCRGVQRAGRGVRLVPAETRLADGSPCRTVGWGLSLTYSPSSSLFAEPTAHEDPSQPLCSPRCKPQGWDSPSPFSFSPQVQDHIHPCIFTPPTFQHLQSRIVLGSTCYWLHPWQGHHFIPGAINMSSFASAISSVSVWGSAGQQPPPKNKQVPQDTTYPLILMCRPCPAPHNSRGPAQEHHENWKAMREEHQSRYKCHISSKRLHWNCTFSASGVFLVIFESQSRDF